MSYSVKINRHQDFFDSVLALLDLMAGSTPNERRAALDQIRRMNRSIRNKGGIVVVAEGGSAITCYRYDSCRRTRQHHYHQRREP